MKHLFKFKTLTFGIFAVLLTVAGFSKTAYADVDSTTFAVSPMHQKISLNPNESYYGTFKITNPANNEYDFVYDISLSPFTVNDDYNIIYENNGDYNQILNWITIEDSTGVIAPNETAIVHFRVDVPADAPAGGQYAALIVHSVDSNQTSDGMNIQAKYSIAHILYAEVAGETIRKGTVNSVDVPSFLFSGNITGIASISNAGNVHSDGAYTLQVFPAFSKEEIFTNEENPTINTILPNATRTTTVAWDKTPPVGIFHVIYNVEYEGVESNVDKYVIVCPIWLLFLIILAIFLIIFRILSHKKK